MLTMFDDRKEFTFRFPFRCVSFCQLFTDVKHHCRSAGGSFSPSSAKICKMTTLSCLFYIPFKNKQHLSKQTQLVKISKSGNCF